MVACGGVVDRSTSDGGASAPDATAVETSVGADRGSEGPDDDATVADSTTTDGPPEATIDAEPDADADAGDAQICVKATCATLGIDCGYAADGCGGLLMCGTCVTPQFCGGGGINRCGGCGLPCQCGGGCQPMTCVEQNIACGVAGDGCGGVLQCGTCPSPQICGGGGTFGQCGPTDASICVPQTCNDQNIQCGPAGDGCGSELMCGTCAPPETCGGAGVRGQCAIPDAGLCCVPETCAQQHIGCGLAGDGCGGRIDCGTCPPGQTCGGGGFARCG